MTVTTYDVNEAITAYRRACALTECEGWPMLVNYICAQRDRNDVMWRKATGTERTEMAAADKALERLLQQVAEPVHLLRDILREGGELFSYKGVLPEWDEDTQRIVVPEGLEDALDEMLDANPMICARCGKAADTGDYCESCGVWVGCCCGQFTASSDDSGPDQWVCADGCEVVDEEGGAQ